MKKLGLGVGMALLASVVIAGPTPPAALNTILTKSGAKLVTSFEAEGGLTGWVISPAPGQNVIAYTPKTGDVVLIGSMINKAGADLTESYIGKYGTKVDYSKVLSNLEKSAYVSQGTSKSPKSVMYVFKDPNCSYCHLAYKALEPYTKTGLEVRWIPVAFLAPDSLTKAASLLEAKDPEKALDELHEKFGKPLAWAAPSQASKAKVMANTKLMNESGFQGTPALVMKTASGEVKALPGMFRLSDIPKLTGLPAIENKDPMLAKFK